MFVRRWDQKKIVSTVIATNKEKRRFAGNLMLICTCRILCDIMNTGKKSPPELIL
jgi:hypothetical protein